MFNFDDANKKSKEAIDVAVKSYSAWTKGLQAIATEAADYSKKSFEEGVAHVEKLSATKSVEAAFELQTNYIKSSYEGFVAEATKISIRSLRAIEAGDFKKLPGGIYTKNYIKQYAQYVGADERELLSDYD